MGSEKQISDIFVILLVSAFIGFIVWAKVQDNKETKRLEKEKKKADEKK